jgi:nickel-dependent lactate racemase
MIPSIQERSRPIFKSLILAEPKLDWQHDAVRDIPIGMSGPVLAVQRILRAGAAELVVSFPPGWRITRLAADPPVPPPLPGALPAPRSVAVPRGPLLVVVNDAQRATPTPWLMSLLDCDFDSPDVRTVIATGCHAPPTEPELRGIFGGFLESVRPRLHVHRAASDPMVRLGTTSRGTPVEVNRLVDGPSAVVCLGSVEPHYFAGWTGGRKSLVPGLGSLETMRANHRLALDPGSSIGALDGNPLHLDLIEAVGMLRARLLGMGAPEPLGVNALAARGRIYGVHVGPLIGSVDALARHGRLLFGRPIDGPAPLVLCFVDHPLDRDFYQALKGLEHWKTAVGEDGILVIVADCPDGIGPPTFTQFLDSAAPLAVIERRARESYRLGDHKLLNFLRFTASGRRVWMVSPHLAGRGGLPFQVFGSVEAAIRAAAGLLPSPRRRALLIEDAATNAPFPPESPGSPEWHFHP